jgi:hypothetical protein
VIRHTALFVWADGAGEEEKVRAKDGVAYCYYGSEVLTLDFGEALGLAPSRHRFSLQHDHRDREAWDAYNANAAHHRAGAFLRSVTQPDLAARVDWAYDGPPSRRGAVRHLELHRWREDGACDEERERALSALAGLPDACPGVSALMAGADLGWYPPNYDWIVEAHLEDVDAAAAFLEHPAYLEAERIVASATRPGETARIQYRMLSG